MSHEQYATTIRDIYGAAARGDLSTTVIDPQIEWIEPDVPDLWFGGTHHGLDEVLREVIEPAGERFEQFRVECDQFLDTTDHLVVTGHFRGHERVTGIDLNAPFCHLWTLQDGRAIRFQSYTDTAQWLYALYRLRVEHPVGA